MKEKIHKTKLAVVWPTTSYFTIKTLSKLNKFVEITLRVRLTNAIEEGKVKEIGYIPGGKGRPQKVFAFTPVTQNTLDKAKQNDIMLVENADKLVNVVCFDSNKNPVTKINPLSIFNNIPSAINNNG